MNKQKFKFMKPYGWFSKLIPWNLIKILNQDIDRYIIEDDSRMVMLLQKLRHHVNFGEIESRM